MAKLIQSKSTRPADKWKAYLKENYLGLGILALAVFIVYANSLDNEFLSDDIGGILQNPQMNSYSWIFNSPWSLIRFFQPALQVTINKIFGLAPLPLRLPNIFFHLGTVYLVFALIQRLFNRQMALFAALLLAVHPLAVESVSWISGGGHVMYTFFLILSLLFWTHINESKKSLYFALIAFFLAITISEKSLSFPLSLAVFAWAYKLCPKNWKKLIPLSIPFLIIALAFLGKVPTRMAWLRTDYYQTGEIANPIITIPIAISSYFELIFWPDKLTLYHSELFFSKPVFIFKIIVFFIYVGLTLYFLKKERRVGFWLAFFGISLAPVIAMANLGIAWVIAERYAYAGAIGVYVFLAWLIQKIGEKVKNPELSWVVIGILATILSIRTIVRNNDWQNQDTLWIAAARTSPSSAQNHNNLGDLYARQGNFQKAIEEFQAAVQLKPNYGDAYHNLANVFHQINRDDLAIENYNLALKHNPNIWQSYQNIAFVYYNQGKFAEAEENLQKAVAINQGNSALRVAYGIALFQNDKVSEAKREFETALSLDPQNAQAKAFLLQIQENFGKEP